MQWCPAGFRAGASRNNVDVVDLAVGAASGTKRDTTVSDGNGFVAVVCGVAYRWRKANDFGAFGRPYIDAVGVARVANTNGDVIGAVVDNGFPFTGGVVARSRCDKLRHHKAVEQLVGVNTTITGVANIRKRNSSRQVLPAIATCGVKSLAVVERITRNGIGCCRTEFELVTTCTAATTAVAGVVVVRG